MRLSTRFLGDHGVEGARLDAELLAAHALGLRRLDIYLQYDRPLSDAELEPIRALLRRRGRGEPVAYITGEREFLGRRFGLTADVLIPRPETELLVERAVLWARATAGPAGEGLRLADLGTGSGCVAVSLACALPGALVTAVDVSGAAVRVAAGNAERLGVAARVECLEGSWCEPLAGRPPFDALVSNPPYVPGAEMAGLMRDVRDFEPALALDGGVDGLGATRDMLDSAVGRVVAGGLVAVEVDHRAAGAVAALLAQRWPGAAVATHLDLAGHERLVEAVLGAGGTGS